MKTNSIPSRKTFTVSVPCKSYIKRFLEINYGNPVDFSQNPKFHRFFVSLLKRPDRKYDSRFTKKKYLSEVQIVIRQDLFYKYGWELTNTNIVKFNIYFSGIIKDTSHLYITFKRGFSELKQSIIDYQELFDLGEDHWSFESIKKEIDRNAVKIKPDFNEAINKHFDRLFIETARKRDLISNKGRDFYLERL